MQKAPRVKKRDVILAQVQAKPGSSLTELQEATGFGWGTIYHHVGHLEGEGLVRTKTRGRLRCVVPLGEQATLLAVQARLRGEMKIRIAAVILRLGPVSVQQVMKEVGCTRRVAYHHVKTLLDAGLVERNPWDKTLTGTPGLQEILRGATASDSQPSS